MIELFLLYKYAFLLCIVAGLCLCLQGIHLVPRKESLQILALSQGALVGNLIGKLVAPDLEVVTILTSLLAFVLLKLFFIYGLSSKKSKETSFIVLYISLISISYLFISIFPGLEGHMSVGFFGDIVSLSEKMTLGLTAFFGILLGLLFKFHKQILRRTFEISVLGEKRINVLEELLFGLVLVSALYGLGFLFSVATIIFPAVIIGAKGKSLKWTLFLGLIVTSLSGITGLGASIVFERLSTVPSQIITLLIFLVIVSIFIGKPNQKEI